MMKTFIGRKRELKKLQELYTQKQAILVVIKGRRRIGKSRLVTEFAKDKQFFSFTGLAPIDGITDQTQRDHFGRQLSTYLKIPPLTFTDWSDAFNYLSHSLNDKEAVVLFDEISWMGIKDPTFVPKLKAWWDQVVSEKQKIMLIFCGSVSTWIEDNIINSTAFFGRISLALTLEPLTLPECAQFLKLQNFRGSTIDVYKMLSIIGGIPWYLEQIMPQMTTDQNIKRLCFDKEGLLVNEFDQIFHDLFNGRGTMYKKILEALKNGMKTLADIRESLDFAHSGTLSKLVEHLITCGFVSKHAQWSLKTAKLSKQSLYRISDPYIRFYLKYIEPNRSRIDQDYYEQVALNQIPGFDSIIGFQVETLLLQNRSLLLKAIGINPSDCVFDNPYQQKSTVRGKGCQIDYLVQTRTKNLYLCEFKFKRQEIGAEISDEIQEKINRLSIPRGFAITPVLFHIGGVTETVLDNQYFYRIIDITDFLE